MKTIRFLMAFWALAIIPSWTFQAEGATTFPIHDLILTEPGQVDFQNLVSLNRQDISRMVLQHLSEHLKPVRELRESLAEKGFEGGMEIEITLGPGVTVSIPIEHVPAASQWDGQTPPDFPFKFTLKNPDAEKTGREGSIQIAYDPKAKETFGVESIQVEGKITGVGQEDRVTIKISGTVDAPKVEVEYGKALTTPKELQDATGGKLSIEQTLGIDSSRKLEDYYTEDMQKSDYLILRWTEELIAKLKWGLSGALEHEKSLDENTKLKTNFKYTFGTDFVRQWWTDWLFRDADEAAQRLSAQLTLMDHWRRKRIENEAKRWGIDPSGKTNNQLIREIWDARQQAGVNTPVFRNPDGSGVVAGSLPDADASGELPVVIAPPITPPGGSGGSSTPLKSFR